LVRAFDKAVGRKPLGFAADAVGESANLAISAWFTPPNVLVAARNHQQKKVGQGM